MGGREARGAETARREARGAGRGGYPRGSDGGGPKSRDSKASGDVLLIFET